MRIECLNPAAKLPASPIGERMLTVDELSQQFRVSTKTVHRWHRHGLVSRRFLLAGRRRVGFLQSSVDCFLAHNEERVRRGARFSRLTDEERQQVIDRARLLAQAGQCLMEVTKLIAEETGRSAETIRYTLKHYDREQPDTAIYPHSHDLLRIETKAEIFQQYRRGESAEALAQRFCQTGANIGRIIKEMRAARIMKLPLGSLGNEQFACPRSEKSDREILGPPPESDLPAKKPRVPGGMPPYLTELYAVPLLTRAQEAHLFRKMNYLKQKASRLRDTLDVDRPKSRLMDQIERLYDGSVATKNQIIRANLRLVVSIAKRYMGPTQDFFELVSDGNMSLLRAAEKFDVSRGNKFSTYASWAIMKNFARTIPTEYLRRDRFRSSNSEILNTTEDVRTDQYEEESAQMQRESQVQRLLDRLDDRERQIITARFGLIRGHEPQMLAQIGTAMGVSKERIRQIQVRAMSQMREAAEEARVVYSA